EIVEASLDNNAVDNGIAVNQEQSQELEQDTIENDAREKKVYAKISGRHLIINNEEYLATDLRNIEKDENKDDVKSEKPKHSVPEIPTILSSITFFEDSFSQFALTTPKNLSEKKEATQQQKLNMITTLTGKLTNDLDTDKVMKTQVINKEHLQFGLSSLHAWIRFFECILHLAYKLVIRKWQARGKEDKQKVAENKKKIQEAFRQEIGLLVDKPKPRYGSSNDGNTARRFFGDPETSSKITGVNKDLISRFKVILATISSGHKIKVEPFKIYCLDTATRFTELYPWYNMPTTVHKILIHSAEIISYAILPIGQLGEEAQEARNKDIKRYRESFSRKFSRQKNMEDVFHRLLISSDPYISNLRKLIPKEFSKYPAEVIHLTSLMLTGKLQMKHQILTHSK
uniref:Uncharacterized protein LOC114343837 n=1 Tax=Diabrotica virgifera virgifera TaxID=50390 RepID=A0A6P7GWP0_DIAVI